MLNMLQRFSLESIKFNYQVLLCMVLVWGAVLLCTISSIRAQPFSAKQRVFWTCFVIFAPLLGVLAYLPFSFRTENYHDLAIWKKAK